MKKSKNMHYNHFSRSIKKTMMLSFSHYLWALMNHCDHFWSWLEESWCWSVQLKPKQCQGPTCKSGTSTWVPQNKLCFSNYSSTAASSMEQQEQPLACTALPTKSHSGSDRLLRDPKISLGVGEHNSEKPQIGYLVWAKETHGNLIW